MQNHHEFGSCNEATVLKGTCGGPLNLFFLLSSCLVGAVCQGSKRAECGSCGCTFYRALRFLVIHVYKEQICSFEGLAG